MHRLAYLLAVVAGSAALLVPAASGQSQITLQYKLPQGTTYRFADSILANTSQEMMGQQVKSTSTVYAVSKMDVAEVRDDGTTVLVVAPESMRVNIKNRQMDTTIVPQQLLGKRTQLEISRLGDILHRATLDSVKVAGLAASVGQRELVRLHVYPPKPVKIGDKWTSSRPDTNESMGGKMVSLSTIEYTAQAKEARQGRECLKVVYSGKTSLNGKGTMMGSSFFLEGSGTMTGTFWADPATGLPVAEDATMNMESTIAVTGQQSMTIPSSQSVTTHRVLLTGKR